MSSYRRLITYGFLLALFAQVALAARQTSITLDEPLHITSGYACLTTGDYRLVEEHPPLVKMMQALPLLLARPRLADPRTVPGWQEANLIRVAQHVVVAYRPIEPLVFAARAPTMLMGILLAALVYRWSTDAFGPQAGLVALILCAFDPNILAHSGVAATDLGAACALFAGMFTFWRWVSQPHGPSWRRCLTAGAVLGLALTTKSSSLILLPVFGALIILARPPGKPLKGYLIQALIGGMTAFLVLWALYRFETGAVPGVPFTVPAPSHLLPLIRLREHMGWGHSAFLMGQNYIHGVWYYFPIAFLLKTPTLTLLALLLTLSGALLRWLPQPGWRTEIALLILPLSYFSVSLTSGINIGYRHLLPILPFLFVWVSRLASWSASLPSGPSRIIPYALLSGYAVVTLTLSPWHLAYFNLLAGGPAGGYRYLVDSNLDWGQTWKALRRYLDEQNIAEFGLSQYTINDPHAYGLNYTPLPPWPDAPAVLAQRFNPPPGIYAISTTQLQGVVVADSEMFDYFRKIEPMERIGHAMFVYKIQPRPPAQWAAECTVPVAPLTPALLAEGLGQDELRVAYFDCTQSWLYPEGNGWYVVPLQDNAWTADRLQHARTAYEQTRPSSVPPFAVHEWFEQNPLVGLSPASVTAVPADWVPQRAEQEGVTLEGPVSVGDALEFLGAHGAEDSVSSDSSMVLVTYWRVVRPPVQPFSLMAHLVGHDGVPIAVGDGLGVSIDQLQSGDIIAQRHELSIPPEALPGVYWLQIGAYTLPDVQRLPIIMALDEVVGDRMLIGRVEVSSS